MSQIICKELSLAYDGKTVIENISFTVEKGDYLCIVGANGSGKSTLVKSLLGLKSPVKGSIITGDGVTVGDIGYLPQQTAAQKDFPASVREIVLSGCLNKCRHGFYSKSEKERAKENMARLEISHLENECYRNLSGGQKQRVLLARALCSMGKILLLDEPVAGLDPVATREMYDIAENINSQGVTVIMVSHDLSAVSKYATHVLHLGQTSFFGTKEECITKGILNERTGM